MNGIRNLNLPPLCSLITDQLGLPALLKMRAVSKFFQKSITPNQILPHIKREKSLWRYLAYSSDTKKIIEAIFNHKDTFSYQNMLYGAYRILHHFNLPRQLKLEELLGHLPVTVEKLMFKSKAIDQSHHLIYPFIHIEEITAFIYIKVLYFQGTTTSDIRYMKHARELLPHLKILEKLTLDCPFLSIDDIFLTTLKDNLPSEELDLIGNYGSLSKVLSHIGTSTRSVKKLTLRNHHCIDFLTTWPLPDLSHIRSSCLVVEELVLSNFFNCKGEDVASPSFIFPTLKRVKIHNVHLNSEEKIPFREGLEVYICRSMVLNDKIWERLS